MGTRGDNNQVVYVDGDIPQLPLQLGQLLVDSSLISPGTTNLQQCTSQDPLIYEPLQGGYPILPIEIGVVDTNYPYGYGRRYGVVADGVTNDAPAVQNTFDSAAAGGFGEVVWPSGTILLRNANTDVNFSCAIVVVGLTNCTIRGAGATKFTVGAGTGEPEFGMFRLQQCRGLKFRHFEMDGSGIPIDGLTGNRSRGFVLVNFDVNNNTIVWPVLNSRIELSHIHAHHIGGFVNVGPRSSIFDPTPVTDVLSIHDNTGEYFRGQDHYIGLSYARRVHVYDNYVENPLDLVAQIGNLFCDASAGCENVLVENNEAIGFTGGAKAETHINLGPSSNQDRVSQNVCFFNNRFLECGDPITLIFPGPGGGGWYGIKLNGVNHSAYDNTITARTTNISTGGLYQGMQLASTAVTPVESLQMIEGNSIYGPVLGINHDTTAADTDHAYVAQIIRNKIYDTVAPGTPIAGNDGTGIIASRNAKVVGNSIYRSAYSAISLNDTDQTICRGNIAVNCATIDHATAGARVVFAQENAGSVGYFEFTDNTILDDRGASAAEYGYFLRAGTTYTNKLKLEPGLVNDVLTAVAFDKYFSYQGTSLSLDATATVGPRTIYTTAIPSGTAPWSGMPWRVGDRSVIVTPVVGSPKAWVCTVAGTPGTWVSEGNL